MLLGEQKVKARSPDGQEWDFAVKAYDGNEVSIALDEVDESLSFLCGWDPQHKTLMPMAGHVDEWTEAKMQLGDSADATLAICAAAVGLIRVRRDYDAAVAGGVTDGSIDTQHHPRLVEAVDRIQGLLTAQGFVVDEDELYRT